MIVSCSCLYSLFIELELMFKLMDRVDDGVLPMLHDLQHHIKEAGLADMLACADIITTVSFLLIFVMCINHVLVCGCG